MPLDHWLASVAASAMLPALPGPTILLVISSAIGRKPAAAIVAGVGRGDLTATSASMLGLGAMIAASATILTVRRWIGGAYLTQRLLWPQLLVTIGAVVTRTTVNARIYALAASAARQRVRRPRVQRTTNRVGGALLIGAGLFAAGWRKAGG